MQDLNVIVVGVAGAARSGKDTLSNFFCVQAPWIKRVALADPIKVGCEAMLSPYVENYNAVPREDIMEGLDVCKRKIWQFMGTEGGRGAHPDLWLNLLKLRIKKLKQTFGNDLLAVVVPDVRFANEANFCREYGHLIHVTSDRETTAYTDHLSEFGVVISDDDIEVTNNGTMEEYFQKCDACFQEVFHAQNPVF